LSVVAATTRLCADIRDTNARHLATPPPLHRRWQLWTAVGVAVLLVITAAAWIGPQAEPDRASADLSAAPSVTGAVASTTTAAAGTSSPPATTGDGAKNLLANRASRTARWAGSRWAAPT
jgi:hypothetical protein